MPIYRLMADQGSPGQAKTQHRLNSVDINGKPVTLPGKGKSLLIFFNPSQLPHKRIAFYAQALYDRFKSNGLQVIGIARGDKTRVKEFSDNSGISYHLLWDNAMIIHKEYQVADCCGGIVILDEKGDIINHFPRILETDTIRQLVEKIILNTINYDFAPSQLDPAALEKQVAGMSIQDSKSGKWLKFKDLEGEHLAITFFSSLCGICKTGKRLDSLKTLRDTLQKSHGKKVNFILVFTRPFDPLDFPEIEKQSPIPFEKYITPYFFSDEERYITDPDAKRDPLTVILGKDRRLIFLEQAGLTEPELISDFLENFK